MDAFAKTPMEDRAVECTVFETDLGWMALAGESRPAGKAVATWAVFGDDTPEAALVRLRETVAPLPLPAPRPAALAEHRDVLTAYAAGEPVDPATLPVRLPDGTPFRGRVLRCVRNIRYGATMTYGEVAAACNAPRAARAVGTVMSQNLIALMVPCHRVVPASGTGNYNAPGGFAVKKRLLDMEAVGGRR